MCASCSWPTQICSSLRCRVGVDVPAQCKPTAWLHLGSAWTASNTRGDGRGQAEPTARAPRARHRLRPRRNQAPNRVRVNKYSSNLNAPKNWAYIQWQTEPTLLPDSSAAASPENFAAKIMESGRQRQIELAIRLRSSSCLPDSDFAGTLVDELPRGINGMYMEPYRWVMASLAWIFQEMPHEMGWRGKPGKLNEPSLPNISWTDLLVWLRLARDYMPINLLDLNIMQSNKRSPYPT